MDFKQRITGFSLQHPKLITWIMVLFTLALGAFIPKITVDTDPENMLSAKEPVRVFHDLAKHEFSLNDIVVLGVVNDKNPEGVFNVASLNRIYELTEFAKNWHSQKDPNQGVVAIDLMAPSLIDHISQDENGTITFEWLMPSPPKTDAEALAIRDKAMSNPLLKGTVVSEDGKALCIYIPLTTKHVSHELYQALSAKIATFSGDDEFYITGLPVAEDTFGYEMFIQMAISAPLAMLVIFLLMLLFFRKLVLIISPMVVAMVSVISTMGLLIAFGFPVHIMSSMIPIFLMPIAVVDSVHILSEFFDLYTPQKGRKQTTLEVMSDLFMPMLYTSLTSAAGFASLALTPIPPVQIFGIFVATGIMIAWVCTITFVPAYIMFIKDSSLANFGAAVQHEEKPNVMSRLLHAVGGWTYKGAKLIVMVMTILVAVAVVGITKIQINDNPIKWFSKNHPIRMADRQLNAHFGGTYMAYLVLQDNLQNTVDANSVAAWRSALLAKGKALEPNEPNAMSVVGRMEELMLQVNPKGLTRTQYLDRLVQIASDQEAQAEGDRADLWFELGDFFETQKSDLELFKKPEMLNYMSALQSYLVDQGLVGKSNSVADIVKKVYQELTDGTQANYRIPATSGGVAQCLMQFQSSHKPNDLWHFVTQDYRNANIWLQLKSGDNKDVEKTIKAVEDYVQKNPPPLGQIRLKRAAQGHPFLRWAGLTYINVEWQKKMVFGMLQSLMGSFIIVFIMMAILFRSVLWGVLCMIPLSITITMIYGIIGLIGKDYDMPVAVLSALTLGMAVDFAIHFLERVRSTYQVKGSWKESVAEMFAEPARAITRNVLVIAIGFLPLLAAPLVPYKTVGIFLCAIMGLSGAVTLLVLPAAVTLLEKRLFRDTAQTQTMGCNCGFCLVISIAAVALVALNLHQNWHFAWSKLAIFSAAAVVLLILICNLSARRQSCKSNKATES